MRSEHSPGRLSGIPKLALPFFGRSSVSSLRPRSAPYLRRAMKLLPRAALMDRLAAFNHTPVPTERRDCRSEVSRRDVVLVGSSFCFSVVQ